MDDYRYLPLDTNPNTPSFRLLRLLRGEAVINVKCEIFHSSLSGESPAPYEALSYTWGCTELVEHVEADGQNLRITENLHSALQCLRLRDQDRVLWIDAICIDQCNKEEQGQQVRLMGKIFGSATRVIFWLGKPTTDMTLLMNHMSYFEKEWTAHTQKVGTNNTTNESQWLFARLKAGFGSYDRLARERQGLQILLRRPWFERVWILQEVINARSAIVCCGVLSISAEVFASSPLLLDIKPNPHIQSVLDIMSGQTRATFQQTDLINLLSNFRATKATDKRDKVFALVGISSDQSDHEFLQPDYTISLIEVIRNTIRYWFEITTVPIRQVLDCLNGFDAIEVTYLIQLETGTEAMILPNGPLNTSDVGERTLRCTRDDQFFLIEHPAEDSTDAKESCHNELVRLQRALDPENNRFGRKFQDALEIVSYQSSLGTLRLLIIKKEENALLLAGALDCTTVFDFIVDRSICDKQSLIQSLLNPAANQDHWNTVRLLVEKGAIFNGQSWCRDALVELSLRSNFEMVHFLLQNGVDPKLSPGNDGECSPLLEASRQNKPHIVQLLLECGANVNDTDTRYGRPLQEASYRGFLEVVQILLRAGANVDAKGDEYGTALTIASHESYPEIVKALLEAGAKPNTLVRMSGVPGLRGFYGTALDAAKDHLWLYSEAPRDQIVQMLIAYGAKQTDYRIKLGPLCWGRKYVADK